jgi:hypothetical protein
MRGLLESVDDVINRSATKTRGLRASAVARDPRVPIVGGAAADDTILVSE